MISQGPLEEMDGILLKTAFFDNSKWVDKNLVFKHGILLINFGFCLGGVERRKSIALNSLK